MAILYAVITIFAWGSWLAPTQRIHFSNSHVRTFYVASANLILTLLVQLGPAGQRVSLDTFWLPFVGGLIWAVSGYCAFSATEKIGLTRAIGIWAPLNIIVGMVWGVLLFGEFASADRGTLAFLGGSLLMMIAGILIIIFARGGDNHHQAKAALPAGGFLAAVGAGILWGSYFIPINLSKVSMWQASLPLAIGIFVGAALLMLFSRGSPRLERKEDYLMALMSGILWGVGNYCMLLLTETIGTGKGFAIAQLNLVVNVAFGIFLLKDPPPGSRAAGITLFGIILALVGGIVLGNLR